MDPISIGLALASLASSFASKASASKAAQQNQALALQNQAAGLTAQQQGLTDALSAARSGQADRLNAASALRYDQNGNATYYDRDQGRWVTVLTPEQERARTGEQAQQERTLARGAQASEDYAKQRADYLYKRPPTEAVIRDEITRLIQQSQGQGERGLNTLMQRFGTRTAGNIPTVQQMDTGPSPSQQLADTMLKARSTALAESQSREKAHSEQYLPALQAFERTANVRPEEGNVGRTISGMAAGGANDRLAALADYGKLLPSIYQEGTKNLLGVLGGGQTTSAGNAVTAAAGSGPNIGQFASLINALKPSKDTTKAGTKTTGMVGPTEGGTYSAGDESTPGLPFKAANVDPYGGSYFGAHSPAPYSGSTGGTYDDPYRTIWGGDYSF